RTFGERHADIRYDVAAGTRPPEWIPSKLPRVGAGTALRQESQSFVIGEGERSEVMANQNKAVMANPKKRMCAHIPCLCIVPDAEEYCAAACRDAGSEDV